VHWAIRYETKAQKMQVGVWKYIIHNVYLLHVSANHMAIWKEVHYKGYIEILQKFFYPMHRYLQAPKKNMKF
jgi:hypothetical protein